MDTPWRFELFGGLRGRRGPLVVTHWGTNRAAALLARLCLFPHQVHPREELLDLLWPDADMAAGRNRLRVALASLRRQLEPPGVPHQGVLVADRSGVRLNPIACRSDVAEFEAALKAAARTSTDPQAKRAALERALSLWAGELLPGFYDDWILDERERLNALYEAAQEQHAALVPHSALPVFAPLPLPSAGKDAPQTEMAGFPLQWTRFFGRDAERDAAAHSLADARLVTLSGPGGVGKTRLAVEVARQAASEFSGPVCWVPLADLPHASLIPDAVAYALGLPRASGVEPLTQVAEHLAALPPALLVLDNFEHVAEDGAPLLFSLLSRVPHLTCLVTSRRRLGLAGERELPVAPLLLPDAEESVEQITRNVGVQIFTDRAQAARPAFQITSANAAAVAQLCRTLDGLPLALELVAARAQTFSPAQMNARLSERFALPTPARAGRVHNKRHASLWTAMAYSYELLPPTLQAFFAGLSVFRGGCTVEAAAFVCAEPSALECLTQLRERSLLALEDAPSGVRFRLLETLREFAGEHLTESAENDVRVRHAKFFLALAEDAEPKLMGADAPVWLATLGAEQNNFRAALAACLHREMGAHTGLRLAAALGRFWQMRGELTEGREHVRAALHHAGAEEATLPRAWALRWAGLLASYQGDFSASRAACQEALTLFNALGEVQGSGWALMLLGTTAAQQGWVAEAQARFEAALTCFREASDEYGIGGVLNNLGSVLSDQGNFAEARPFYEEALLRLQAAGNKPSTVVMLTNLGTATLHSGDLIAARRYLEESLALRREMGIDDDQSGHTFIALTDVAIGEGQTAEAWTHLRDGMASCLKSADQAVGSNLLELAARLHCMGGAPERAASLLGTAARLRQETGLVLQPAQQEQYAAELANTQAALSPQKFAAEWAAGEAQDWQQAMREALADADKHSASQNAPLR